MNLIKIALVGVLVSATEITLTMLPAGIEENLISAETMDLLKYTLNKYSLNATEIILDMNEKCAGIINNLFPVEMIVKSFSKMITDIVGILFINPGNTPPESQGPDSSVDTPALRRV